MKLSRIGVDLAKNVYQLHGVDRHGKTVWKRRLRRGQWLQALMDKAEPGCEIGMEACTGAHHWARELQSRGYTVRLIAPQFVKPYVKSNKNDANDAAEEIDHHLLINVRATLLLVQAFASQHDGRDGGRIVFLISGQERYPMERELAYSASKAAVNNLSKSMSSLLASRSITVNAVNPGPTDTGWASEDLVQGELPMWPLGRWGNPDDAARLIAWLCIDEAKWITGQTINSDGGWRPWRWDPA